MAKIECYNCKEATEAIAPRYRCGFCNYPLYKYIQLSKTEEPEEKVIKNIKEADHSGPGIDAKKAETTTQEEESVSLMDTFRNSNITNTLLSKFSRKKGYYI